jgi:hypothetical protein
MSFFGRLACLFACLAALSPQLAAADPKTVCTITVNSPNEKQTFERHLPRDEYRFVELVERGRQDWLASACSSDVKCDALIISGHFDGGTEFYTDRLDVRESLPVHELERASCSESCPGLFSQLKEVYLFGCNTLNAEAMRSASAEIVRSLVRSGHSATDAAFLAQVLGQRYGESNRDRMRNIFKDVPVVYGFSSKAPLGHVAGPLLDRYFESAPSGEIASGRVSPRLLALFAPSSMTVTAGSTESDPHAAFRRDVCQFADDRLSEPQKVGFMHDMLRRDTAEVRMFLDHLEQYSKTLGAEQRQAPKTAERLADITADRAARQRYLEFMRDADETGIRVRMIAFAQEIGWLTPAEGRSEFLQMIFEHVKSNAVGSAEVDLVCARDKDPDLGRALLGLPAASPRNGKVANAAMLACLGNSDAHARMLQALTSPDDSEVSIAQVYLRHRPLSDATDLRAITARIARMPRAEGQVHALDTLAGQGLADPQSLEELARLFPVARSVQVQRAIAGILIRSDYRMLARSDLAQTLRKHRFRSPDGEDVIDALIRRLQAP